MPVYPLTDIQHCAEMAAPLRRPTAVLCDIDGCLYDWTRPLDLTVYSALRRFIAGLTPAVPVCLMTGRSVEFVKVLAALLGLDANPGRHLCELGALILDGVGPDVTVHPIVVAYGSERLRRERVQLMGLLSERLGATFEPSRDFTCNVVTVGGAVAARHRAEIAELVRTLCPAARVLDSGAVVDIALVPLSKANGVHYLAAQWDGFDPAGALAIGDSENDLDVFPLVGFRAAPANAAPAVKAAADYVSPFANVAGVHDIIAHFFGSDSE